MQRPKLKVEQRTVTGKKVETIRQNGFLPANIYGKGLTSIAVQVPYKDFENVYKEVGETGLVDIQINNETRPVLIHHVQEDHRSYQVLHADFYQVNLKEKIKTMVPVELVGEAKAVADKLGLVLQTLSEVEVEALPENLPEKIEVDITPLAAVDEQITVAELKKPAGVEILTDPTQVIVKISELVSEEAKADAAAAEAAAAQATAEGAAEGEAPKEGDQQEAKPEEKKTEEPATEK